MEKGDIVAPMVSIKSKDNDPLITNTDDTEKRQEHFGQEQYTNKRKMYIIIISLIVIIAISIIITLIIVLEPFSSSSSSSSIEFDRYLIIISLDGFRSDYFDNPNISSPNIHEIAKNGVHIKRLIPVYPSLTFPNHYSIATGLYPGDHGIVSNSFWDPVLNEQFFMWTNDNKGKWFRGEPIWNTHRTPQNINNYSHYKSGTIFWVGSDHNCSGNGYPEYYLNYNQSYPFKQRVDDILSLLRDGSYRLIMGYFEQPDKYGHEYGPNSVQVANAIKEVDDYIGILINGIKDISEELYNKTDIVIVSDHGMTDVSMQSLIHINYTSHFNLSDTENFRFDAQSSNLFIKLTEHSNWNINDTKYALQDIIYPFELVQIYDRDDLPFDYINGYNDRVPDIFVMGPIGYQFIFDNINITQQTWLNLKGNHGYNNTNIDMSALFVAQGPSFKSNYTKDMTQNIHLYELFCYLMDGMTPSPNNGSLLQIQDILLNT